MTVFLQPLVGIGLKLFLRRSRYQKEVDMMDTSDITPWYKLKATMLL